jgi:hypothetical protein
VLVLRLITAHTIEERILETATRKLGMDQKVIGAGGFNNASDDPMHRKSILEKMLRAELTGRDDQADVHTLKEINKRVARSEQEYLLFKRMDEERFRERERRAAAGETVLPELVAREELPEWLVNPVAAPTDPEKARFKDIEGMSNHSFGRGKRRKAEVDYSDQLNDDEFCMLVERGATDDEVKAFIAERNKNGAGAGAGDKEAAAAEEEEGDEDHVGPGGADQMEPEEVHKKRKTVRVAEPADLALQAQGQVLLDALSSLKDAATGRAYADNWRLLWGPDGPRERKRGRPVTADKPLDMTDVGNKLKKLRYKRLDQVVTDLDKMFNHLLATLTPGSRERAEAEEGAKLLHRKVIELRSEPEPEPVAAAAVAVGAVESEGVAAPLKKLKLKLNLSLPAKEDPKN